MPGWIRNGRGTVGKKGAAPPSRAIVATPPVPKAVSGVPSAFNLSTLKTESPFTVARLAAMIEPSDSTWAPCSSPTPWVAPVCDW